MSCKCVLEVIFCGVEGKISHKQFRTHAIPLLSTNLALFRLIPTIGFKIITEPSSPEDSPCLEKDKRSNRSLQDRLFSGDSKHFFKGGNPAEKPQKGQRTAEVPVPICTGRPRCRLLQTRLSPGRAADTFGAMAKGTAQFEGLLDRFFNGVLEDNPVYANMAGLKSGEGKLGQATKEFETRQEDRRQQTLSELDEISPRDLDNEQQLDRLALRSLLLREMEDFARGRYKADPDAPERLLNILLHELQRGEDEPERAARNIRSLLREVPRFLTEGAVLVETPERVWLRVMEQTVSGAEDLFEAVKTFLQKNRPAPGDEDAMGS